VARSNGISDQTIYAWREKYAGMTKSDLTHMNTLEEENRRLKNLVAEFCLDNAALKALRKMVSPAPKRRGLEQLMTKGVSRRLGGRVVGLCRSASRAERKERRPELHAQIIALAEANPRYAFRRIHALLEARVNLKAVHRIWREEGLGLTTRKRRRIQVETKPEPAPTQFGDV
jgi:putative transposase